MADIKLGLLGSEVTLPQVNDVAGQPPDMTVGYVKQVDRVTMSDGSTRYNARTYSPKTFPLSWARLTGAEIATIQGLADYNVPLHFLNEWIDATWRWVRVTEFRPKPVIFLGTVLYSATMSLEEEL